MKSIFPLRTEYEDPLFDDPDKKFNSLKFSKDIPEPFSEPHKLPPLNYEIGQRMAPRQQGFGVGLITFVIGWYYLGNRLVLMKYGNAITRWRQLWISLAGGIIGMTLGLITQAASDYNFSVHSGGRRRTLYYEESVRHALDAKFGVFENINKIMVSKERISREEFYEVMIRNYEKFVKDYESKN